MSFLALAKTLAASETKNLPPLPFAKIAKTTKLAAVVGKANNGVLKVEHNRPDTDAFEERAVIAKYDGGLSRADAEQLAAQCQVYDNVVAFTATRKKHSER